MTSGEGPMPLDSTGNAHLGVPPHLTKGSLICYKRITKASTIAFYCSPECNMCKRLYFEVHWTLEVHCSPGRCILSSAVRKSWNVWTGPLGESVHFLEKSRRLDSFKFNWSPGWLHQHLVKVKPSLIPWLICSNVHKHNLNEPIWTLFKQVFAPNEIWIVTCTGKVQPELCTHHV